ncbi:MAG: molecular chaperone HtpG [Candidatus Dadabacteria bacterium]|nr:molecular chaperone HtpG [Candidatus Dadabacteria bacterium]NIQ15772.1 molecular chaperone HtpG [Candidatus Dadabacteria bacterium]
MSNSKTHEFQAEVKKLLDIVIHSLYTDKEIFIRELVSNASDALEKLRYIQLSETKIFDEKLPLEIEVKTNNEDNTITIIDHGIGMTEEELVQNLGTIAHSGSKSFLEAVKKGESLSENLIGQFGVGFYSSFMVADSVEVYTHSYKEDGKHLIWKSDGSGTFEISEGKGIRRGTKIVVHLKEDEKDFSDEHKVDHILKKYSSFVQFPIKLNGEQINKVEAIWLRNKNEIKDDEYNEFYKFQTNAFDEPGFRLHFSSEAPIDINTLLFVPSDNIEKMGFGRMEPGVSLYCKKILIDPNPKGLLPEWLRFLKGVVDSADLPLNISRETMQDSNLVVKLNSTITKRFLKFLEDKSKEDTEKYNEFYSKFGFFIKEGAASDFQYREQLQRLLRFESSKSEKEKLVSFEQYVSNMPEDQSEIYYLFGPNRESIEDGPQMEAFKSKDMEVLFIYEPIDEFVMSNLKEFDGKKIVSADSSDLKLDEIIDDSKESMSVVDSENLCTWIKETLGDKVDKVRVSKRLVESPVIALNSDEFMSHSMKKIMKVMTNDDKSDFKINLEINSSHELIKKLFNLKDNNTELAKIVVEQIYDNALLAAGFIEDPRNMVGRIYKILEHVE